MDGKTTEFVVAQLVTLQDGDHLREQLDRFDVDDLLDIYEHARVTHYLDSFDNCLAGHDYCDCWQKDAAMSRLYRVSGAKWWDRMLTVARDNPEYVAVLGKVIDLEKAWCEVFLRANELGREIAVRRGMGDG